MRTKLFSNAGYAAKYNCTKMLRNLNFFENLHILASDHKTFLFFRATFELLSLQSNFKLFFEQHLSSFLRNYGELFAGKSRATCGKP